MLVRRKHTRHSRSTFFILRRIEVNVALQRQTKQYAFSVATTRKSRCRIERVGRVLFEKGPIPEE